MKCYYEILNVSRDADFSEIKSNYRKCALKWHPDKNLDNPDYAKEQFQLVQQAYEVLSDPLERSWYDKHRDQIIFGSNTDYEDNSLNVYQYFTSSCFKGYNDNDDGFYTIYRKVFDQIIEEDLPFIEDKDEIQLIPRFGYSNSDYDEIVAPFYSYWSSYCTRKNYAWLDPFDITHLKHGKLAKLNEKEFKKIRQMAKKERNEEIRSLVSFIRKRDKRVQVNKKKIEDKIIMNREKQQKLRKQKIIDRKKELESCDNIEAEWSKFDNLISQLEEIERNLTDDDDEQSDNMDLYCVACNKVFKTKKTFQNHEASKKHKENVEILTQVMLKEETSISVIVNSEDSLDSDFSISEDEEENLEKLSKTKKKQKKTRGLKVDISKIEEDINLDNLENTLESSNKKKKKISVVPPSTKINKPQEEPSDELKIPIKRDKHEKKESIKNKTKVNGKNTTNIDLAHCCVTCRAEFPSKNKLFNHLKKTGHGVYINPKLKNKIK